MKFAELNEKNDEIGWMKSCQGTVGLSKVMHPYAKINISGQVCNVYIEGPQLISLGRYYLKLCYRTSNTFMRTVIFKTEGITRIP